MPGTAISPPKGGGAIGTQFLRAQTSKGRTTAAVPGDVQGRRQQGVGVAQPSSMDRGMGNLGGLSSPSGVPPVVGAFSPEKMAGMMGGAKGGSVGVPGGSPFQQAQPGAPPPPPAMGPAPGQPSPTGMSLPFMPTPQQGGGGYGAGGEMPGGMMPQGKDMSRIGQPTGMPQAPPGMAIAQVMPQGQGRGIDLGQLMGQGQGMATREMGMPGGMAGVMGGQPAQNVGPLGTQAIGLNNLGGLLERNLAQPSAFGMEEVQGIRNYLAGERKAEFAQGMGDVNADAANRGVFYSTLPNKGAASLMGQQARAAAMSDAQLMQMAAQSQDSGMQNSIRNAMDYLRQGQDASYQNAIGLGNLGNLAGQQGDQGAPDLNSIMAYLAQQGGGAPGGVSPDMGTVLSHLFGGQGQPVVPRRPAATTNTGNTNRGRTVVNPDQMMDA